MWGRQKLIVVTQVIIGELFEELGGRTVREKKDSFQLVEFTALDNR